MGKFTISMVIFNSYFDITRGYIIFDMFNVKHVEAELVPWIFAGFIPSKSTAQHPIHQHAAWSESLMHHVGGVEVAQPPGEKNSEARKFSHKTWKMVENG